MKVKIGTGPKGALNLDVDVLMRTRLLIQANSGGGKSFLVRRLAEQLFGKVQVIIIDPEGEFASLREKYGYVLVGQGGETPADLRSAGLVAEKLLELHASAVCDLFESFRKNPQGRHTWVKTFCNALLDAPKKFWHPVVIILDEGHTFCPESKAGKSEATGAVIGVGTAGRKRGMCLVIATQRLGKLNKDVSAELLNRLIGPTFEDIDLERAADVLSIAPHDKRAFFSEMRVLEPGNFYALGRAICKERTLVKVGEIETTHPEIGKTKFSVEPPPPPDKVKALLPKLVDLPKAAEERAQNVEALKAEVRQLKSQLRQQPHPRVDESAVSRAMERAKQEAVRESSARMKTLEHLIAKQQATMKRAAESLIGVVVEIPKIQPQKPKIEYTKPAPTPARKAESVVSDDEKLTTPEQRILDAIAWLESLGIDTPEQPAVSFLAGYAYGAGGFNNPRGALRTKGLVEYVGDRIKFTEAGRARANFPESALTNDELHQKVLNRLPNPEQRLLRPLLEAYPGAVSNDELAERSGYKVNTGGYNNPRGRLRTLGLIEYLSGSQVRARSLLFPSYESA